MTLRNSFLGVAALIAAAGQCATAGIVAVDKYDTMAISGSATVPNGVLSNSQGGLDTDKVIGGERTFLFEVLENPLLADLEWAVRPEVPGLSVEMGSGLVGVVTTRYDAGGAGLDFDATAPVDSMTIDSLVITFLNVDLETDITATLTDGDGRTATITRSVGAGLGVQAEVLFFSDFTLDAGFDFTEIDGVDIAYNMPNSRPNRDVFVSMVTFETRVPAPGAAVLACGGMGLMAVRRRR